MHYLSVTNLAKSYGIKPLFTNLNFHIQEGDRIAIVARNGIGKSTLLRILNGNETADEGKIWIHKDVKVFMIEQDPILIENKSILENIFFHKHPIIETIRDYEAALENEDSEALQNIIPQMDELQAWDFESKINTILTKLNIHHLQQPASSLSGGQRKRLALAKVLIDMGFEKQHLLLLMDEPTNHLDVEMIEWLEKFLIKENITLLLVTHDRYFLDNICNEIWEIDNSKIQFYKGNFENYIETKAAQIDSDLASIDKAKNIYRRELVWMRKQPKARTTKSKSRQDKFIEVEKNAHQNIAQQNVQLQMKMNRLGGKVVEFKKVSKNFDNQIILKAFDYTFKKGERIGIVGKNGVGKTTFIQMAQGLIQASSGKINIGDTVIFGNFSQQGLQFKEDKRVIEFVRDIAENFPLASGGSLSAAQFLQLFLFDPDKQYTYLSKLSGGEKKRLQLLSILFSNPNFLILDEPTNDLDLPTLQVLEQFLNEFMGCLLVVSHDRYFMDKLIDHLFVFEGNGIIRDFVGNYTQYRIEELENKELEFKKPIVIQVKEVEKKMKLTYNEKREFEQLHKEIESMIKEKDQITTQMTNANLPFEELNKFTIRLVEIQKLLDDKELRWLQLSELN